MAETTGIAWCDATFNPWVGCEKVSPGCAHCYAETLVTGRMARPGTWGADGVRQVTSDSNWKKPPRWARLAGEGRLPDGSENPDGHRPRVFCASLADVFEERPELEEPRRRLFDLIAATPELDWLILTKRPDVAHAWMSPYLGIDYSNVWMGVSIENARYTWRADVLREIPATVRFISAEPLLGSLYPKNAATPSHGVDQPAGGGPAALEGGTDTRGRAALDLTDIDWIIIGGESGPGARPFHLEHAREIILACRDRDVVCCQNPPGECCGRPLDTGECCGQPVQGSQCCGEPEQLGPGPAVFVKQLGARPVESGERYAARVAVAVECEHGYDVCPECDAADVELKLRDRKGGDIDEFPPDLRVREFPRPAGTRERSAVA